MPNLLAVILSTPCTQRNQILKRYCIGSGSTPDDQHCVYIVDKMFHVERKRKTQVRSLTGNPYPLWITTRYPPYSNVSGVSFYNVSLWDFVVNCVNTISLQIK